ncbi:hypothetical protein [Pseudomonas sp. ANT_H12B]
MGRLIFDATADNRVSQHEKAQGDKAIQEAIEPGQQAWEFGPHVGPPIRD